MASRDQIVSVCESYISAVESGDVDAIMALYADDPVLEDPVGTPPKVGRDAVRSFYEEHVASVTMKLNRVGVVTVAENNAVFQFSIEVDLGGGATMGLASSDVMRFDEAGKVVAMTAYPDGDSWPE